MRVTLNNYFIGLIGLCLFLALFAVVLDAGIHATPWDTTDSQGRTMQFNDRFSAEHYQIALGHFRPWQLLSLNYLYDWLLMVMLCVAIWCLKTDDRCRRRLTRWFFVSQSALFFFGWMSLVFMLWPRQVFDLSRGNLTREDFIDVPFTWVFSQPPWVVVSLTIAIALPGQSLGLKDAAKFIGKLIWSRI